MRKLALVFVALTLIAAVAVENTRTTESGLTIVQLEPGVKLVSQPGDYVYVSYTGKLDDGTVFDSSASRPDGNGAPSLLPFKLGAGVVIKGFDEGMLGMSVGDRRKLIIPSKLGYGDQRVGSIPPSSRLTFEVELVRLIRPAAK